MEKKIKIQEILLFLDEQDYSYEFNGNTDDEIIGISSLLQYKVGTMTWIRAGIEKPNVFQEITLLVTNEETKEIVKGKNKLIVTDPKMIFFAIVERFFNVQEEYWISNKANISDSAQIDKNVSIGAGCIIEENVKIASGTRVYNNVVIKKNTTIGKNCIIKSGTVIGEEGYGYSQKEGSFIRVPHLGSVIIGDNVEIGANTCIDRGTIGDTTIGKGTKIDNLCHIAHNVMVGENAWVIAGTIIGGSAKIGDNTKLFMNVAIRDGVEIAQDCVVGMGSVVTKNFLNPSDVIYGIPAKSSN